MESEIWTIFTHIYIYTHRIKYSIYIIERKVKYEITIIPAQLLYSIHSRCHHSLLQYYHITQTGYNYTLLKRIYPSKNNILAMKSLITTRGLDNNLTSLRTYDLLIWPLTYLLLSRPCTWTLVTSMLGSTMMLYGLEGISWSAKNTAQW